MNISIRNSQSIQFGRAAAPVRSTRAPSAISLRSTCTPSAISLRSTGSLAVPVVPVAAMPRVLPAASLITNALRGEYTMLANDKIKRINAGDNIRIECDDDVLTIHAISEHSNTHSRLTLAEDALTTLKSIFLKSQSKQRMLESLVESKASVPSNIEEDIKKLQEQADETTKRLVEMTKDTSDINSRLIKSDNEANKRVIQLKNLGDRVGETTAKITQLAQQTSETDKALTETKAYVSEISDHLKSTVKGIKLKLTQAEIKAEKTEKYAHGTNQHVSDVQSRMTKTEGRMAETEDRMAETERRVAEAEQQKINHVETNARITEVENSTRKIHSHTSETQTRITSIETRVETTQTHIVAIKEKLSKQIEGVKGHHGIEAKREGANLTIRTDPIFAQVMRDFKGSEQTIETSASFTSIVLDEGLPDSEGGLFECKKTGSIVWNGDEAHVKIAFSGTAAPKSNEDVFTIVPSVNGTTLYRYVVVKQGNMIDWSMCGFAKLKKGDVLEVKVKSSEKSELSVYTFSLMAEFVKMRQ